MGRTVALLVAALLTVVGLGVVLALPRARPSVDADASPTVSGSADPSVPPGMAIEDLYAAFHGGGEARSFGEPVTLATTEAGELMLPSGGLIASDGMILGDDPFTLAVPPGRYEVSLLTADFPTNGDHRVAAALVRIADGEPVAWQLALIDGQDPSELGPDEIFGYAVDSGSGAFLSPEAAALLADDAAYEAYSGATFAAMFPDEQTIIDSAVVAVDAASGANVVAFSSGFGDGVYATWVGLTAGADPLVFMTDFGVLDAASP